MLPGERIRDYAEDRPFPSALFFGYVSGNPLHVVAACDDAKRLARHEGEQVRMCSRYGEVSMPVRVKRAVKPGELFATFYMGQVFLNQWAGSCASCHATNPGLGRGFTVSLTAFLSSTKFTAERI